MIWALVGVLVLVWLLGVIASIGGALIHILLAVALVVAVAECFGETPSDPRPGPHV
jgi:hypothetical protein